MVKKLGEYTLREISEYCDKREICYSTNNKDDCPLLHKVCTQEIIFRQTRHRLDYKFELEDN